MDEAAHLFPGTTHFTNDRVRFPIAVSEDSVTSMQHHSSVIASSTSRYADAELAVGGDERRLCPSAYRCQQQRSSRGEICRQVHVTQAVETPLPPDDILVSAPCVVAADEIEPSGLPLHRDKSKTILLETDREGGVPNYTSFIRKGDIRATGIANLSSNLHRPHLDRYQQLHDLGYYKGSLQTDNFSFLPYPLSMEPVFGSSPRPGTAVSNSKMPDQAKVQRLEINIVERFIAGESTADLEISPMEKVRTETDARRSPGVAVDLEQQLWDPAASAEDEEEEAKKKKELAQYRALKAENRRLRRRQLCRRCKKTEPKITLLPCGHFLYCSPCAQALSHCGLCHRQILADVITYIC